jgi:inward rectifier potassium channel
MKRGKFGFLILSIYITANLIFAAIYYVIGIEHIGGVTSTTPIEDYFKLFFFSSQTFTTVGFGHIHPVGTSANIVTTIEAFIGLMSFALATGLFYGRFSRPQAFIRFSEKALIAPFKDGTALMFRIAPFKNNALSEIKAEVTLAMQVEENGKMVNKFFDLDLQFAELTSLALSWTLVHPITEKSPLYGFSETDLKNTRLEVLPFIKAFDEVFSNTVMTRYSYISKEIVWGAKFKMMFQPNSNKSKTVLDISKLSDYELVALPEPIIAVN